MVAVKAAAAASGMRGWTSLRYDEMRYWPVEWKVGGCAVCALRRRKGVSLGTHTFKGAIHA